MKKLIMIFSAAAISVSLICGMAGCSKKVSENGNANSEEVPVAELDPNARVIGGPVGLVLNASAFKMTGDYADNVAVTIGPDGNLIYFPAPSDITPNSKPIAIGDGWYLNKQGLGPNSVFTKYTFKEYAALKSTPSIAEIKAALIPGARVSDYMTLPVTASEASKMKPAELLKLINN